MGEISDFLFGRKPKKEIDTLSTLSPEQQELVEFLQPFLTGENLADIQGVETPPLSDLQTTSLAGLEQLALGIAGGGTEQQGLLQTGRQAAGDILTRGPTDIEDFFRTNIADPSLKFFREEISPDITSKFAPSGFFSSERLGAEETALENLLSSLVRSRESVALGARQQDTNAVLEAIQSIAGLGGTDIADLTGLLVPGELEREAFREKQAAPIQERERRLAAIFKALGLPAIENVVTTTPGTPGLINTLAGAAAKGFASTF